MFSSTSSRPRREATTRQQPAINESSNSENDNDDEDVSQGYPPGLKAKPRGKAIPTKQKKPTKRKTKTLDSDSEDRIKSPVAKRTKKVVSKKESETMNDVLNDDRQIIGKSRKQTSCAVGKTRPPVPTRLSKCFQVAKLTASWTEPELLAQLQQLDYATAQNIVRLFEDDNTIPFICRYRKEVIGDLSPDQLRDIKITYNHVRNVKAKAQSIIKTLTKGDAIDDQIRWQIESARSLDELDHLYAPFKPASKVSHYERSKALGLLAPAENFLFGDLDTSSDRCELRQLVDIEIEGLETLGKVETGVQHIVAHIISKDTKILEEIRALQKRHRLYLVSKVVGSGKKNAESTTTTKKDEPKKAPGRPVDPSKFETYFDFRNAIDYVKPHQTLAINRGESLKVLTVKVEIPSALRQELYRFACVEYLSEGVQSPERHRLFDAAFEEAYTKKLQPLICRQVRTALGKAAEVSAIEVFATNLKQLLLMSPVKGQRILGIDPGFTNGCKVALISECTDVLATDVIYPHTRKDRALSYGERIAKLMQLHDCKLIALGNGTACRETERWLGALMAERILDPSQVKYSIVSEQGASIYSCGEVARKEFPDLDVNLISAVSIARRLGDPLGEFVKVEAKHLGVGMYQHDVNDKLLTESLNEVVMECVSFVGVDINTASVTLLRHVAGLTAVRAENIIKHRNEHGPFRSRDELKLVRQIGEKTFVQCAGFVRIEPLTTSGDRSSPDDYNPLDSTWVHPESYDLAAHIVHASGSSVKKIGSPECIAAIQAFVGSSNACAEMAQRFGQPVERIQSVVNALQRELLRDYRTDLDRRPLFKQGLTSMADLREGTVVSGAITNQTHFGCFVDIGVEKDGLIHVSQMGGKKPSIGDRVEASVTQIDVARGRIQLKLLCLY